MNNNTRKTDRNVDIVFCIDGTGSMRDCIDTLKDNALKFQSDLSTYLLNNNTNITSLRVKLITFRDYGCDVNAMVETDFYELPLDEAEFKQALSEIEAAKYSKNRSELVNRTLKKYLINARQAQTNAKIVESLLA